MTSEAPGVPRFGGTRPEKEAGAPEVEASSAAVVVGIDCGGSKSLALVARGDGELLASSRGEGANPLVDGAEHLTRRLEALLAPLDLGAVAPRGLCIGISGAGRERERRMVADSFSQIGWRGPLRIVHDAELVLAAGCDDGVGLALVAGTGSIAFGRDAHGEVGRAGGYGHLLSDEGSGYWMVRRAIREALKAIDGRGPATSLGDAIVGAVGGGSHDDLLRWFYEGHGQERSRVAALLPVVAEAAASGDQVAASIVDAAAGSLAELVAAARRRLRLDDEACLILGGGAFRGCPALAPSLRERLAGDPGTAGLRVRELRREPAWGAVRLAQLAAREAATKSA
ncbi:MAG: ATPase [Acidobacteria bacterium]|nr:MAG: ATPase [Acidobacteriota bacterium]REK07983.1 MAG: ATPase [Acidobacteriota bacterium]